MRRQLTALTALLTAVLLLALTGCGSDGSDDVASTGDSSATTATTSVSSTTAPSGGIEGQEWVLDATDSSIDVPDGTSITLSVTDGQASGTSGCNSYGGSFEVDGTDLTVGPLIGTQIACEPAVMDAESAYLTALGAATTADVTGDSLVITGPDDARLSFTALDREQALVGTWDVIQLATADAVTSVLDGTQPTVEFVDDGTLSATTGCNTGSGSWTLDGDQLTIGPLASTRMACADPAGIMDQEADLFADLEASKQVQVTADSLTLLRADGTITLVATAAG